MTDKRASPLALYCAGLSAWFAANGIQMVLFPWLAAVVLELAPAAVGAAQMTLMGPAILLMLYAGALADRGEPRRILLIAHLLAAVPPVALAIAIEANMLSLSLLLLYGIAMGTVQAFAIPTRDAILPQLVKVALPQAVALATDLQFGCQLLGIGLAYLADRTGAVPLLIGQAVIVACGAITVAMLPRSGAGQFDGKSRGLAAMREAIHVARADGRIWPVLAIMVAVGIFYGGTFMVAIPIAVRDAYRLGADGIAMTSFAFWGGSIATSFALAGLSRKIGRPGAVLLLACSYGILVLFLIGLLLPWWAMLVLCFAWGLGAGVVMTLGRTAAQALAPPEMRGRILALFQLAFVGGGPLGALLMGTVTQLIGPAFAMWFAGGCMVCVLTLLQVRSRLSALRLESSASAA